MNIYPFGLGEALGDDIATCDSLQMGGGVVFYVHHTGSDAYAGLDRVKPKATIGAAVTDAVATPNSIVLCLSGHTENITTSIAVTDNVFIVGAGSSGGVPTVTLTRSSAAAGAMFAVAAGAFSVLFANIKFAASSAATTESRIKVANTGIGVRVRGCYFESGANDSAVGNAILYGEEVFLCSIEDTTFISTATVVTAQPGAAVAWVASASASVGMVMTDVTFSGGACGFGHYGEAFDDTLTWNEQFRYERISLLLGADFYIGSGGLGVLNVISSHSGGNVSWA